MHERGAEEERQFSTKRRLDFGALKSTFRKYLEYVRSQKERYPTSAGFSSSWQFLVCQDALQIVSAVHTTTKSKIPTTWIASIGLFLKPNAHPVATSKDDRSQNCKHALCNGRDSINKYPAPTYMFLTYNHTSPHSPKAPLRAAETPTCVFSTRFQCRGLVLGCRGACLSCAGLRTMHWPGV